MGGAVKARKIGRATAAVVTAIAAIAAVLGAERVGVWRDGASMEGACDGRVPAAGASGLCADSGTSSAALRVKLEEPASSAGQPPWPTSLSGSIAPRLPLGSGGELSRTRAVRDFFDYFLSAQNEVSPAEVDAMVRRAIAAQLDGTPAHSEALDVWGKYRVYREAVARIAPLQMSATAQAANGGARSDSDIEAMQAAIAERASMAERTMGAAWSEAFFGHEWRRAQRALEQLRVTSDATLTDVQKAARLEALTSLQPKEKGEGSELDSGVQAGVTALAALQQQGMPLDELRATATQALGPEVAQRAVQMQSLDNAWRARYERYAAQRAQIDAMGLAPTERADRVAQLRERAFATVEERQRAASWDWDASAVSLNRGS
jgi:lipase chaperone LimK